MVTYKKGAETVHLDQGLEYYKQLAAKPSVKKFFKSNLTTAGNNFSQAIQWLFPRAVYCAQQSWKFVKWLAPHIKTAGIWCGGKIAEGAQASWPYIKIAGIWCGGKIAKGAQLLGSAVKTAAINGITNTCQAIIRKVSPVTALNQNTQSWITSEDEKNKKTAASTTLPTTQKMNDNISGKISLAEKQLIAAIAAIILDKQGVLEKLNDSKLYNDLFVKSFINTTVG